MDRKFEQIATNYFWAIEGLETKRRNLTAIEETAGEKVVKAARKEVSDAEKEHKKTNEAFYEAFKFPLEIFHIDDEQPKHGETVYVYSEIDRDWTKAEISTQQIDGAGRFVQGLHVLGSPNNYENYVRWIRLPVLSPNLWEF